MRMTHQLLGGLLLAATTLAAHAQGQPYAQYHNARFGYSISYPQQILTPQPESDNGDGRRFVSADGQVILTVYGGHNVMESSIQDAYSEQRASRIASGCAPSYQRVKDNWFVLSGACQGTIYYQKTMLAQGQFKSFLFEYPQERKAEFDGVVTEIARSFRG